MYANTYKTYVWRYANSYASMRAHMHSLQTSTSYCTHMRKDVNIHTSTCLQLRAFVS